MKTSYVKATIPSSEGVNFVQTGEGRFALLGDEQAVATYVADVEAVGAASMVDGELVLSTNYIHELSKVRDFYSLNGSSLGLRALSMPPGYGGEITTRDAVIGIAYGAAYASGFWGGTIDMDIMKSAIEAVGDSLLAPMGFTVTDLLDEIASGEPLVWH